MPRRLPKGCSEDTDRHGNHRIYYRAPGRSKVRLRGTPWTPEFMAAYERARTEQQPDVPSSSRIETGTWGWLCERYFVECADFKRLDPVTQRARRRLLQATFDEPFNAQQPDSDKVRNCPLEYFSRKAIEVLRDRKIAVPEAANARLKAIRQVFRWAIKQEHVSHDPARDVEYFKSGSTGHRTWTADEVTRFQEHFPIGTKARLAMDLLLYTGQRKSDVTRFGPGHVHNGTLVFTQHKGRNSKPKALTLPILPELQATLDATPYGKVSFLETDYGVPFTDNGFGGWFAERCIAAGVPGRAHGLRKAGATIAADNGATVHMLMAIFGWNTIRQAEVYTRAADQRRLAQENMHRLVSHSKKGGTSRAKTPIKSMGE